jgi:hypothetical protein
VPFKATAKELRKKALFVKMAILVWGPGDPGPHSSPTQTAAYKKRLQIKDVLAKTFKQAEVRFSEDKYLQKVTQGILGQLKRQAIHARGADLVLMLDISRGADLELDHFVPTYPWFRDKVYVLLKEQYVPPRGLVKEVFDYLTREQVIGFSDKQFRSCEVATKKAVDIAISVAIDLMLQDKK